jgi:hypothetical protein
MVCKVPSAATRSGMPRCPCLRPLAAILGIAASAHAAAAAPAVCSARSGTTIAPIVELYTSEGCSSCPPADRWLSTLKADPAAVAFAFHVDYWDYIGWKDRFAHPVHGARQGQQLAVNGARVRYTPQVVVNGTDRPAWPALRAPLARPGQPAVVAIELERVGASIQATVTPLAGAPTRLAAWWAVTEHDHTSRVRAGENDGTTLRHDFVVREFRPVAAWSTAPATGLRYTPSLAADPAHPGHVSLVVVDATTGRPLQALRIAC